MPTSERHGVGVVVRLPVSARAIVLQPTPAMPADTLPLMLFVFRDIAELFSGVLLVVLNGGLGGCN